MDDDVETAKRAYARSTMGYALGQEVPTARERGLGYRGHFERMGFTEELGELDRMRTGALPGTTWPTLSPASCY